MKEGVKQISKGWLRDSTAAVLSHIAVALLGLVASRATVIGTFAPFGISFVAGMPAPYIFTSAIGAALGYFLPTVGGAFRYFAALFAACTIKALLSGLKNIKNLSLCSAATAFAASISTSLASVAGGGMSVTAAAIEAVLSAAGGYFFHKSAKAVSDRQRGLSSQQLASVIISINICLLGLYTAYVGPFSLGHIVAAAAVLAVSKYAHAAGGAIAGSVASLFLLLSGGPSSAAVCLSAGGMLAGIFAPLGSLAAASVFTVWSAISAFLSGEDAFSYLLLAESAFGAAIFLALPKAVCVEAGKLFSPPTASPSLESLKRALTLRLFFASEALSDVSETVSEVSRELKLINSPDFDWVVANVKTDGCNGCSLHSYCWERKQDDMRDAILEMSRLVKAGESHPADKACDEFRERCIRPRRVENAVLRYYEEYASRLAAEARIEEVRGVVSDQFEGISDMLYDLGVEFERYESFDGTLANKLSAALRENDLHAADIAAKTDKYGRVSIEMRLSVPPASPVNRMELLQIVNSVCERDFEPPVMNRIKNYAYLSFTEKAAYEVSVGVSQLCQGDGTVCGDAYTYFPDGRGRMMLLLSDGMGTGGRAAVDGAMASGLMERLLKAGFGYDCALKIVNSSMLFKSSDESLATLDISCIDLYTGTAELLKAGAAPTVIRRSGRTGKAQSTSLPAGILRDIGFDRANVSLKAGDILLMMSDGATATGTDWICAELESYKNGSAQQLAEKIAAGARRRRNDGHDDDITVIAAILEKAV
ncbi:MAG: SpoIIE family protein phosphatase [Clostridia bacterium]|nr:SpoIIE family protein phosphatase [Clostridia bacterium]